MTNLAPPSPEIIGLPEEQQLLSVLDEELDACDYDNLDLGLPEESSSNGKFSSAEASIQEVFPMEVLSKMSTFGEVVENLPDKPKKAEDAISEAMSRMALQDREKAVRDLYGMERIKAPAITASTDHVTNFEVTTVELEEENGRNPIFLQTKLDEMDAEIHRMKQSYGWNLKMAALELAEQQNIEYTRDPKFRLQFLRCDRFDTKKAATRFIRYFDWKLELFGEHTLTRSITWTDLTSEDQAMLRKGYLQRLPVRDRAGRSILFLSYLGQVYESPQSMARQYFYMFSSTDEETDSKGLIGLYFKLIEISFRNNKGFGGMFYVVRFMLDFPARSDAYHAFKEEKPTAMGKVLDYCLNLMNPEPLARTRVHIGKYIDWITSLMSFGIPHDVIPLTQSYKLKTKNHREYLSTRIKAEQMLATNTGITPYQLVDLPTRRDVLLGKGRPIQFSSGNQALSMIVDGYMDRYHHHSSRVEKTRLANEILQMLQSNGVRFLSREPHGIWMEVSHEVAREKISHMFRKKKEKKKNSIASCSDSSPSSDSDSKKAGTTIRKEAPEPAAEVQTEEQAKRLKL